MKDKEHTKVDQLRETLKRKKEAEEMHKQKDSADENAEKIGRDGDDAEGAGKDRRDISVDEMADQIRSAEEEAKGHYDKLLRVMAEFDNFKKRMQREREELVKYGNEKLLSELVVPLDDLERVFSHVSAEAPKEARVLAEGVELVLKSFKTVFERFDLIEVPAENQKFDPSSHEAIAVIESDVYEPGSVMAVHRKGYRLGERLLRPALVTVSKASNVSEEKNIENDSEGGMND